MCLRVGVGTFCRFCFVVGVEYYFFCAADICVGVAQWQSWRVVFIWCWFGVAVADLSMVVPLQFSLLVSALQLPTL